MVFKKIFGLKGAKPTPGADNGYAAKQPEVKKGAAALEQYEELRRKGGDIPGPLFVEVGECYRQLGRNAQAEEMFRMGAARFIKDEAWTHAAAAVQRARRLSENDTAPLAILRLQVALGRGQSAEASEALDDLSSLLVASDGAMIEEVVRIVHDEVHAEPEVEVSLAEMLTILGRPDRAIERLRSAKARAIRLGRRSLVSDLENRLREIEGAHMVQPLNVAPAPLLKEEPASSMPPTSTQPPMVAEEAEVPESLKVALVPPLPDSLPVAGAEGGVGGELESSAPPIGLPPLPAIEEREEEGVGAIEDHSSSEERLPVASLRPEAMRGDQVESRDKEHMVELGRTGDNAPEPSPGLESLEAAPAPPASSMEDKYISLAAMREEWSSEDQGTRIVGTDGRELYEAEDGQLQHLVETLLDGLRAAVPSEEVESYYELGVTFLQMEMFSEAIEQFQVAFRSPKFRIRAAEGLAQSFIGRGDAFLAHRAVDLALSGLDGGDAEKLGLLYWKARAAEAMGKMEEARDLYEQVSVLDTSFEDALSRLRSLWAE